MGTLYIDRRNMALRHNAGRIELHEGGRRIQAVPVALLERVIVHRQATIDAGVISALAEGGAALVVIRPGARQSFACLAGSSHNDAGRRLAQYAAASDDDWRNVWSVALMGRKLRNQLRLLHSARDLRPEHRHSLTVAINGVRNALESLAQQEGEGFRSRIRGVEGAAAAAYFRGLQTLFAPTLNFTSRNRRPPKDPVNACLSLCYTLIHAEAVHSVIVSGLDPFIGFYHDLYFGRESLACDLVEPLRPLADEFIWQLFRDRTLRPDSFTSAEDASGGCRMGKAGRRKFYSAYESVAADWRKRLRRMTRLTVRSLLHRQNTAGDADASAGARRTALLHRQNTAGDAQP